jgi:hypothetical protein
MAIGRNDKCSCGSGKKYKQCCLKKEQLEKEKELAERKVILEEKKPFESEKKPFEEWQDDDFDMSLSEEINDWYKVFRKIEDSEILVASFESMLEDHPDWLPKLSESYYIMEGIEKKVDTDDFMPLIGKWDNLFPHFQSESKYYYKSLLKEKYCNGLDYSKYLDYYINNADDEVDEVFSLFRFFLSADDLAVAIPFAEKVVSQFSAIEWQFELYEPIFFGKVLEHLHESEEVFVEKALSLASEHSFISNVADFMIDSEYWIQYYQTSCREDWPEMKDPKTMKYKERRMPFYEHFGIAFTKYLVNETKMSTTLAFYTTGLLYKYNDRALKNAKSPLFDLSRKTVDATLLSIARESFFSYNLGILNAAMSGLYYLADFLELKGYYTPMLRKKIQQDLVSLYKEGLQRSGLVEVKIFDKVPFQ